MCLHGILCFGIYSILLICLVFIPSLAASSCGKKGYFYTRASRHHPVFPNCHEGMWIICKNCTVLNRCELRPCTTISDATCGPQVKDIAICSLLIDPNCGKKGYFYTPNSVHDSFVPNCHEGVWLPCRDCALGNLYQLSPCTELKDTECGPMLNDDAESSYSSTIATSPTDDQDRSYNKRHHHVHESMDDVEEKSSNSSRIGYMVFGTIVTILIVPVGLLIRIIYKDQFIGHFKRMTERL